MKKLLGRLALLLLALVTLAVAVLVTLGYVAKRERNAAVAALQKPASVIAYEQLTAALASEPDSEEEAREAAASIAFVQEGIWSAEVIQHLEARQDLLDAYRERIKDNHDWWNLRLHVRGPFDELSAEQQTQLTQFLETHQDLIAETREMAAVGGPVYPLDLSRGFQIAAPHVPMLGDLARLLCLDALAEAHAGNTQAAIEDIVGAIRLGDSLANEPILWSQLARVRCYVDAFETMRDTFPPGLLATDEANRILACLAQAGSRQAFAESLKGETFVYLKGFDKMRRIWPPGAFALLMPRAGFAEHVRCFWYASPLGGHWSYKDETACAEFMMRRADATKRPYLEAKPAFTRIEAEIEEHPWQLDLWAFVMSGSSSGPIAFYAFSEAMTDLMRIGILLEQHHAKYGAYPESLDPIAPKLGGTLPVDPFTGRPYVYRPSDDTFLLYSLGKNETDNGGNQDLPNDDVISNYRRGDIVWRGRQNPDE